MSKGRMFAARLPHTPSPRPSPAGGRGSAALLWTLLLAACGSPPVENAAEPGHARNQSAATAQPESPKIDCASPGDTDLAPACTLDRTETPDGVILTLRHPDGAFHRLLITRDGRGVIAADGAEPAKVTPLGPDRIQVELGGARYRLPATVRGRSQ
ncbi:hypothetical protein [Sphingomonas sp. UNC305MFCol5.2]|uniref:hypothetical protein n=1 Tax=Sphingomonas sp. UNC305MFCol5.2 TaxID=1449076 RepID=UPI0018CBFD17|nr:hypothetical protein [Sphingomonas sp. UNC305MFCol5.2]